MDIAALKRFEDLAHAPVLCVGDLMVDVYITGLAQRLSPEAPVPVLHAHEEFSTLGGVGNVARNLQAVGVPVQLVGCVGWDAAGQGLRQLLAETNFQDHGLGDKGVWGVDNFATIRKVRYMAATKHLLRVDHEAPLRVSEADRIAHFEAYKAAWSASPRALVLSDYGKGLLTRAFLQHMITWAREEGIPVIVDPKGADYTLYNGATLITPNRQELALALGRPVPTLEACVEGAREVLQRITAHGLLVTLSADGMVYVPREGEPHHLPTKALSVFDVSGAGDTVVAMMAAGLAQGWSVPQAMELATLAASVVVAKVGTAVATLPELFQALLEHSLSHTLPTVFDQDTTLEKVRLWRAQGERVGFTNGCFDVLHSGHLTSLVFARQQCDRLVVGVNADVSVQRLKGPSRPIQDETTRAQVLSMLSMVDAVVLFKEDTPAALIEALAPHVLIKGGQYAVADIAGAESVLQRGGEVILAPMVPGQSTTHIVQRMTALASDTSSGG